MNYPVFFRDEAKIDFLEACAWYANEPAALDDRFSAAVEMALDSISSSPQQYNMRWSTVMFGASCPGHFHKVFFIDSRMMKSR